MELVKNFEETLKVLNYKKGLDGFLRDSVILGSLLGIGILYYALIIENNEKFASLSLIGFFLPLILNYFYILYLFEKRKKKIEEEIPDLLLIASSLPEKTSIEKVVHFMAEDNTELSQEFRLVQKDLKTGLSIEEALEKMKKRNKSLSLNRAIDLLINALRTGAEMNTVFRETAEDFMETNAILRERTANTTVEKYTLLLAGGIIVPLILGLLAGMVSGFNFSTISELGIGLTETARKEIVEASLLGNLIYIIEYALIASAFVAFQENNQKKTVLYASILTPISIVVYFLGKGF